MTSSNVPSMHSPTLSDEETEASDKEEEEESSPTASTRTGHPASTPAKRSLTILPCFIFVECVVLGGVGAMLYFLQFTDYFPPVKQGFYCRDPDYSKPYVQTETIQPLIMYGVAVGLPAIVIILGETFLLIFQKASANPEPPERTIRSGKCHVTSWMRRVVRFIGVHLFGACLTVVLANVLQMLSGRLSPYFLSVCLPDYSQVQCQDNPFILTDICTGTSEVVQQARKSFPSMPSALGGYAMVYLAWYIQVTLRVSGTRLLKPLLVVGAAGLALVNAVMQLAQYRCHLMDAAVGLALGAAIATYLVVAIVNTFKPLRSREELLQYLDTDSDVTSTISPSTTPSKPLALPRPSVRHPHNGSSPDVRNSHVNDWRKGVNDRRPLRSEENYITRTTSVYNPAYTP